MSKSVADAIRSAYTPFAFSCECNGTDASCREAMNDVATQIRYYTMLEIAAFVERLDK